MSSSSSTHDELSTSLATERQQHGALPDLLPPQIPPRASASQTDKTVSDEVQWTPSSLQHRRHSASNNAMVMGGGSDRWGAERQSPQMSPSTVPQTMKHSLLFDHS